MKNLEKTQLFLYTIIYSVAIHVPLWSKNHIVTGDRRLYMNEFVFQNKVKVFFGHTHLPSFVKEMSTYGTSVLIAYGSGSVVRSGLLTTVEKEFKNQGIKIYHLSGIEPNPKLTSIQRGIKLCKDNNISFVIGLGGGSVMDAAKAIAIGSVYDGDVWDFYSYKVAPKSALPIGTIPTLAATGSEMNSGSVITNEALTQKNGYGHELMFPKATWMNPKLTTTVPKFHTAAGIADILAHIFEFYFHNQTHTVLQDNLQEALMKSVISYGTTVMHNLEDEVSRANLMWASSLALNGFISIGQPFEGYNHLMEHVISAHYDISHGAGLALIMPKWLEYILNDQSVKRISQFARNVMDVEEKDDYIAAKKGIIKLQQFFNSIGLPSSFSEMNIKSDKFEQMAKEASNSKGELGRFVTLSTSDLVEILNMCQ